MRSYLPVILVLLGVFTGVCIAYVAWELSADDSKPAKPDSAETTEPPDDD